MEQDKMEQTTSPLLPKGPKRALIIEDDELLAAYYQEVLGIESWETVTVSTGQAGIEYLCRESMDVLLLDIYLPDMTGLEVLRTIQEEGISVVVVAMTSQGSMELAVEAMREGAYDFLEKPIDNDRLLVTMGNALKHLRLTHAVKDYEKTFCRDHFHGLLGASLPMQSVFRIIESAAPSKATVFITGESGTGKELCAEAIHKQSPRAEGPFITLNCAAIPKELMESEIFGHVKGAFTGATSSREGAAARADGGTLFLDEVCEMDLDLQSKFLRFFQSQRFQKVGASKEEAVDVRVLCATNRNPQEEVQAGRFREDLFYRLHVVPISMPPLRERGGDVLLIANCFLKSFTQEEGKGFQNFSPEVEAVLLSYPWPGNVRELQNVVRNIVVLHDGGSVTPDMLPPPLSTVDAVPLVPQQQAAVAAPELAAVAEQDADDSIIPLWQVEMRAIEGAINRCGGNIQQAADLLDINPSTIYRKRKKWATSGG
jgi:two-component system repressor protein LuxO